MTKTSISDRCAMRTGAERENLLLSETRKILRACSMMAREISTSRISKSRSVPVWSIADVPMTAKSTRNCSICSTVTAPTMPPSLCRTVPPVRKISIGAASVQFARDMQVVGDDQKAGMSRKRFRDLFRRRANIDEQRRIVRDQPRRGFSDQSLVVVRDELPGLIGEVLDSRRDNRAAMNANHTARFAEFVEVAPDGLQGDAEMRGKILDRDPPRLAQQGDDLRLPLARSRSRS